MTEGQEASGVLVGGAARRPRASRHWLMAIPAYVTCGWGIMFAAVHLYWLFGGTLGLPQGLSLFANKPLFVIDIIAIPLCIIAALLALALVRPWGRRFPRRLLLAGAWGGAALFVVHAVPAIPDWVSVALGVRTAALTPMDRFDLFLYEPWFLVGGILFGMAAWRFQRWSRAGRADAR
ncbi:MAG: DUF3995 domain-containing protein [Thermomicrobiales bacterium]